MTPQDRTRLRGMAAVAGQMLGSGGKRGRGTKDPRGALNASHRVLHAAGKPLNGQTITTHVLGLGWWESNAGHPVNGLVHSLNNDAKIDGIIAKPSPGLFAIKEDAPEPMIPSDANSVDPLESAVYVYMIRSGSIEPLPGVDLPDVSAVDPKEVAAMLGDETLAEKIGAMLTDKPPKKSATKK